MKESMKIALVANTSWSLYNFRLSLIKNLTRRGVKVILIAPVDNYTSKLIAEGYQFIPIKLNNYGTNPFSEIKVLFQLFRIYKKENPDFVFHYTIKPNLYGTIAARLNRIPSVAVTTGLGSFVSTKNRLVKIYARNMYRLVGKLAEEIWFLNNSDLTYFLKNKLVRRNKTRLLPSEGVNTDYFKPMPEYKENDGITRFLFVGRLIKEKGIYEYVEAARQIRKVYPDTCFQILGFIEPKNPGGVKIEALESWHKEGVIEFLGNTEDVRPFIAAADCVVLPSYREGISRTLLEAGAMGIPIIASRVPGCEEVVKDKVTGFLIKPENTQSLVESIIKLYEFSNEDKIIMGKAGRKYTFDRFSHKKVLLNYFSFLANFSFANFSVPYKSAKSAAKQ